MNRYQRPQRMTQLVLAIFALGIVATGAVMLVRPPIDFETALRTPPPTPTQTPTSAPSAMPSPTGIAVAPTPTADVGPTGAAPSPSDSFAPSASPSPSEVVAEPGVALRRALPPCADRPACRAHTAHGSEMPYELAERYAVSLVEVLALNPTLTADRAPAAGETVLLPD